jgi:hypothetical protein
MLFGYVSYQVVVTEALKDVSFGRNASLSVHAANAAAPSLRTDVLPGVMVPSFTKTC